MHPRCRSTISAVVEGGKRTAKGKSVKVPADWNYEKWRESIDFLLSEENLAKIRITAAKSGNILTGGLSQVLPTDDIKAIAEKVNGAPENIRILWNLAQPDMKILDSNYRGTAHYSPSEQGVYFDIKKDRESPFQKPYRTLFHELGHFIDNWLAEYEGYMSVNFKNGLFGSTLKQEAYDHISTRMKDCQLKKLNEVCSIIVDELVAIPNAEQREVSDIWHGATGGKIHGRYGHVKKGYWTENQGENLAKEAFAHMFCATIQNSAALTQIKKYFPVSYAVFEAIIKIGVSIHGGF